MKLKSIYVCSSCGAKSPKWNGQCLQCGAWDTLVEDVVDSSPKKVAIASAKPGKPSVTFSSAS